MVVRLEASHVLRSTEFKRVFYSVRAFRACRPRLKAGQDASAEGPRKFTKTKKSFAELPKVFTLPDGTPTVPLGDWLGGLEARAVKKRKSLRSKISTAEAHESGLIDADHDVTTDANVMHPISEGLAESQPEASNSFKNEPGENIVETASVSPDISLSMKPRRGRKPKNVPEVATDIQDSRLPVEDSSPHESPKRRRRLVSEQSTEEPSTTPAQPQTQLAVEILGNLAKFPHCILLTRVGQFYESYFDQAAEVARLLNIKLTTRSWGGQRILMCGFPVMHLDKHLKMLVQQNKRFVAMCEEFLRSPAIGPKGGFDRRVTRVITPGTLIDEPFLNQYENNYLLAVASVEDTQTSLTGSNEESASTLGLAWIDVSTGEFFTKCSSYESLRDDLARIGPREIVLDTAMPKEHRIRQILAEEEHFVSFIDPSSTSNIQIPELPTEFLNTDDLTAPESAPLSPTKSFTTYETAAVKLLTTFLHANLLEHMPQLSSPNREATEGRMQVDAHTIKALEIREGLREGGTTGSLLSAMKRTKTSGGTRLLVRWLCSPSTSLKEINARQSLVAFLHSRPGLREDLINSLTNMEDATRIVQKFLLGRGDVSDLSSINSTIMMWSSIQKRMQLEKQMEEKESTRFRLDEWTNLDLLMSRFDDLRLLSERISMALLTISEPSDGSTTYGDVSAGEPSSPVPDFRYVSGNKWSINPAYSEHLQVLHDKLYELLARKDKLELHLQKTYDAPSLTLRSSPGQGMHVHIARTKRDQGKINSSPLFVAISESGSTKSFFYQEWSQLGGQIVDTTLALYTAEKAAFEALRNEVNAYSTVLRRNARIMDELDVTLGFTTLAVELNFVRPTVTEDTSYIVVNGRHPTVELGLLAAGRVFTPNTVQINTDSRLHIITGPNMAGKSTLLRQTALIAILAQTGSFVPADSATVGIVDRLFSRVGAKDDLFRDRSTFMVEMLETADILRRATSKSLVIMDEVGRGTTVKDGLAIAFGTICHLYSINQCRALFATHFHEVADMLGYSETHKGKGVFASVGFFCTDVDETQDGRFAYSHRLRPGVNRDSHGLKVAQLAGVPQAAMAIASNALVWLKSKKHGMEAQELKDIGQLLAAQKLP